MPRFTLTIDLDNDAFVDDCGDFKPGPELADCLARVARDVEFVDEDEQGTIRDYNGNRVGQWDVVDAPEKQ